MPHKLIEKKLSSLREVASLTFSSREKQHFTIPVGVDSESIKRKFTTTLVSPPGKWRKMKSVLVRDDRGVCVHEQSLIVAASQRIVSQAGCFE